MLQGLIIKKVIDVVMKQVLKQFKLDKVLDYVEKPNDLDKQMKVLQKKVDKYGKTIKYTKRCLYHFAFVGYNRCSFKFNKVIPGTYSLDSYELKDTYKNRIFPEENLEIYYSGLWDPFEQSARFVIYTDPIDIRAHWTIEGINIVYD